MTLARLAAALAILASLCAGCRSPQAASAVAPAALPALTTRPARGDVAEISLAPGFLVGQRWRFERHDASGLARLHWYGTIEILEAPGGVPTRTRFTFDPATGGEGWRPTFPGRAFACSVTPEDEIQVEAEPSPTHPGEVAKGDIEEVRNFATTFLEPFYRVGRKRVGDTWTVERFEVPFACKLVSIREAGGRRFAQVESRGVRTVQTGDLSTTATTTVVTLYDATTAANVSEQWTAVATNAQVTISTSVSWRTELEPARTP